MIAYPSHTADRATGLRQCLTVRSLPTLTAPLNHRAYATGWSHCLSGQTLCKARIGRRPISICVLQYVLCCNFKIGKSPVGNRSRSACQGKSVGWDRYCDQGYKILCLQSALSRCWSHDWVPADISWCLHQTRPERTPKASRCGGLPSKLGDRIRRLAVVRHHVWCWSSLWLLQSSPYCPGIAGDHAIPRPESENAAVLLFPVIRPQLPSHPHPQHHRPAPRHVVVALRLRHPASTPGPTAHRQSLRPVPLHVDGSLEREGRP